MSIVAFPIVSVAILHELHLYYVMMLSCSFVNRLLMHGNSMHLCIFFAKNLCQLHYCCSSIVAATYSVQSLTLTLQEERAELIVHCGMAKGAEDKHCMVEMRNQTRAVQHTCFATSGTEATCILTGLALGKYMIWAYDWDYKESPAVERVFLVTKKWTENSING